MPHISEAKQTETKKHRPDSTSHAVDDSTFTPSASAPLEIAQLQRMIGNRQTSRMVGSPVQRLMSLQNFKTSTAMKGKVRWKIKTVDTAIRDYHALQMDDYAGRTAQLTVIINNAQHYVGLPDNSAKRKPGVNLFLPQATKEKEIIDFLVTYAGAGTRKAKYDELNKAQDSANQAEALGYDVDDLHTHVNDRVSAIMLDIRQNEPAVLTQILQDDVQKLNAIALDPTTPAITRDVLNEVLGNIGDVNLREGKPGARHTNAREQQGGIAETYTVEHSLTQSGGTTERLGSLAHELTHVSSGESYDNTPLFLLFDPATPEDQIINLANTRKNEVQTLQGLYANDPAFSPNQKTLIKDKLDYALQSKLGTYVARFREANRIDKPTGDKLMRVHLAIAENNTLIEFDSVINQCLVYMHKWGIPQGHAFYVKLMQVAQDAYDAREDARA